MIRTQRKNNDVSKGIKLQQIADLIGGELVGERDITITGIAGIEEAEKGDITVLSDSKYLPFLRQTRASAVITSPEILSEDKPLIRTVNPSRAFNKVVSLFMTPSHLLKPPGVHTTAVIGKNVSLAEGVFVGPHAVIEDGSSVGARTIIDANTFIGRNTRIGNDTIIYPNVTIREQTEIGDRVIIHSGTVIGSDGFGYESAGEGHLKIPQIGSVHIEDDVEIGANVCIDRGRFKKTWIKKGAKIDNLVQIAHNVVVGPNCLIVSQAGVSGSTELGKNVVIAGQAGIVGHITLGDKTVVGAGAGVTKSWPAGSVVLGSPAKPIAEQKRIFALISRLPELFKEIAQLKKKLKQR